jgi:hypothetical protein
MQRYHHIKCWQNASVGTWQDWYRARYLCSSCALMSCYLVHKILLILPTIPPTRHFMVSWKCSSLVEDCVFYSNHPWFVRYPDGFNHFYTCANQEHRQDPGLTTISTGVQITHKMAHCMVQVWSWFDKQAQT